MNYFERELRKIVRHCEYIRNPKYVGRACVGRLTFRCGYHSGSVRFKVRAGAVRGAGYTITHEAQHTWYI